jgi:hypothetical protein
MMSALVQHLFESTAFATAVALLVLLLRNRGPAVRYRLWHLAAAKFALPTALLVLLGESARRACMPRFVFSSATALAPQALFPPSHSIPDPTPAGDVIQSVFLSLWMLGAVSALLAGSSARKESARPEPKRPRQSSTPFAVSRAASVFVSPSECSVLRPEGKWHSPASGWHAAPLNAQTRNGLAATTKPDSKAFVSCVVCKSLLSGRDRH